MICSKCKQDRPEEEFAMTSCRGKPLRRTWCRGCLTAYYREYAGRVRAAGQAWEEEQARLKERAQRLLQEAENAVV